METENDKTPEKNGAQGDGRRTIVLAAAALIVVFGLKMARDMVVPIMMAAFLAIISYSITGLLRRYLRFPHWLAVAFTVLVDFGILIAVGCLINYLALDMRATLQGEFAGRFNELYAETMQWLGKFGMEDQARAMFSSPQDLFQLSAVQNILQTATGHILSLMSTSTLVLILMTFLLGEAPLFLRNLRAISHNPQAKGDLLNALRGIQKYLFIKTIASLCTGLLVWALCVAMNVPFAFLWGVLAYVLNYIPTIGSIAAAIPGTLMALLMGGWGDAAAVGLGYLAINCAIGNGVEPLFLGKQFGIATSVVLLSVLFWGWVWGPCGMLLAVPVTVLIKLALENSRDLSWVAHIIDDHPKKPSTTTTTNNND